MDLNRSLDFQISEYLSILPWEKWVQSFMVQLFVLPEYINLHFIQIALLYTLVCSTDIPVTWPHLPAK